MANKRIILLSDGTGNSAGKVWRTNVWRTFESLDLTSSEQIAFYDDGVGTSSFKPFALLGGAFGFGLKRNVLDIYKFVCRNYCSHLDYLALEAAAAQAENRPERHGPYRGDDIFGFGFSRGAFTMRVVNGLICQQGLVRYHTEKELDQKVRVAYRALREENFKSKFQIEWLFRKLRNFFVSATHDKTERPVDHVAFLGLWDTVAAYGLPVDEMTRGISRYLFPLDLPDRQLHPLVRKACHALSLDDERTTFHPLLWDESAEPVVTGSRTTDSERISQVWFAGVHANVGGGYPDDSLAHVSLTWMLSEARQRGLTLKAAPGADPDAFNRVRSTQDKDGRIYDSRNGLSGYYRYGPRSVAALSNTKYSDDKRDVVYIAMPKIHESVLARVAVDAHLYAPVGLPGVYEVVTYEQRIVSPDCLPYEKSAAARRRDLFQEQVVGSSIWRRRIVYFLTVIASVHLLTYPLASQLPESAEVSSRLRPISDLIRIVALVLPSATDRWVNAYARDPLQFLLSSGLVVLLLWLSANLQGRIADQMRSAWRMSLGKFDIHSGPSKAPRSVGITKILLYGCLLLIALVPLPGMFGYAVPSVGEAPQILIDRMSRPYFWFFAVAILSTMLLSDAAIASFRLKDGYKQTISNIKLWIAPALFAAFFAAIFLFYVVGLANHYIFNLRDSFGEFCTPDPNTSKLVDVCKASDQLLCKRDPYGNLPDTCTAACRGVETTFDTRNVCTSTRVKLEQGQPYRFEIRQMGDWSFLGATSGAGGVPAVSLLARKEAGWRDSAVGLARATGLSLAYPIKRSFDRPFGRVIIRYGETGNEENFIDPDPGQDPKLVDHLEEQFKPTRNGELYVYLNQPVSAFWPSLFNNVNSGTAHVRVYRVEKRSR
jgi:uncharacterized protein (DUF2235 family)